MFQYLLYLLIGNNAKEYTSLQQFTKILSSTNSNNQPIYEIKNQTKKKKKTPIKITQEGKTLSKKVENNQHYTKLGEERRLADYTLKSKQMLCGVFNGL